MRNLSITLSVLFMTFILFTYPASGEHWMIKPLPDSVAVFRDDLIKYSGGEIDKEVARLKKEIETTPIDRQQDMKDQIKAFTDAKNGLQSLEIGTKLYESTKKGFKSVQDLGDEWENNGYSLKPTSFLPEEVNLRELKTYGNAALKGYDYYKKIGDLSGKLAAIDTQGYSAETANLVKALTGLGTAMSEWGEKVPFIGAFIKGYGDLTVGFMDAVGKLNKTVVNNINQGCIGTGTRADSGNMNQAWDEQGLAGITACRENGLANVYANLDKPSELYLWDPLTDREVGPEKRAKKGRWWFVDKVAPGLTLEGLEKRYKAIFEKSGGKFKNPSAKQVLHEYAKAVELKLTAENLGVIPGGKLKLRATGTRVADGEEISGLFFEIHQLLEDGTVRKIECKAGETVEWQAPVVKGPYTVSADLQKESSDVWRPLNTAELKYFVGKPTFTRLSLKPVEVIIDQHGQPDVGEFNLLASVSYDDGIFPDKGMLNLTTDPAYCGSFSPNDIFLGSTIAEGNIELTWTPHAGTMEKGVIRFEADYEGYESKYDDLYICPGLAEKELRIYQKEPLSLRVVKEKIEGEKKWKISVSVEDRSAKPVPGVNLTFSAGEGGFVEGSGLKRVLSVDAPVTELVWVEPDVIVDPVGISVTSSELRTEGMILYPETEEVFSLPEIVKVPTKIILKYEKDPSTEKTWILSAQVLSAIDETPLSTGQLKSILNITADSGVFSSSDSASVAIEDAGDIHSLSWIEPSDLTERVKITASFPPFEGGQAVYAESTAFIHLPPTLLASTRIGADIIAVDIEQNLWEVTLSVKDSSEKAARVGLLKVRTDRGALSGGFISGEWDLSVSPTPVVQWQGGEGEAAELTINYSGDGKGGTGENLEFSPSSLKTVVPPEQDLDPPVIAVSGVHDNGEHEPGTRVSITVSDNSEAPLSIDGILSSGNETSAISFSRDVGKHDYTASLTLTEKTTYTIDVKASDAMKNEAQKIISFQISEKREEPLQLSGRYRMSSAGRAMLEAYRSQLNLEIEQYALNRMINQHKESCSICNGGNRRLVDGEQFAAYQRSRQAQVEGMGDGGALGGYDCPPGWECPDEACPALEEFASKGESLGRRRGSLGERSIASREAWEAYIKGFHEGHDDLKSEVGDELDPWTMDYHKFYENMPTTIEEAEKRSREMDAHVFKKYQQKMKEAGLNGEESRIWDKYDEMLEKAVPADCDCDISAASKFPDRRWGRKRALEKKVRREEIAYSSAIPEFMEIEELYITVVELDARQKAEEKKYLRKVKDIIVEIKAESGADQAAGP